MGFERREFSCWMVYGGRELLFLVLVFAVCLWRWG